MKQFTTLGRKHVRRETAKNHPRCERLLRKCDLCGALWHCVQCCGACVRFLSSARGWRLSVLAMPDKMFAIRPVLKHGLRSYTRVRVSRLARPTCAMKVKTASRAVLVVGPMATAREKIFFSRAPARTTIRSGFGKKEVIFFFFS